MTTQRLQGVLPNALMSLTLSVAFCFVYVLALLTDRFVLRPIPGSRIDQVVYIEGLAQLEGLDSASWWSGTAGIETLSRFSVGRLDYGQHQAKLRAAKVSERFFAVLDVRPAIGRTFDDRDRSTRVAVLSHSFWTQEFDSQVSVLQREIVLNGATYEVVGVMPEGFGFPGATQVWVPGSSDGTLGKDSSISAAWSATGNRSGWIARTRDGVGPSALRSELEARVRGLNNTLSSQTGIRYGEVVMVRTLRSFVSARTFPLLLLLSCACLLVLIAASANSAALALTQSMARSKDFSIRITLGATRWRLIKDILKVSLGVSWVSGLAGSLIAILTLRIYASSLESLGFEIPTSQLAATALAVCFLASTLSGLIIALAPAVWSLRVGFVSIWRDSARQADRWWWLRRLLISGQVAMATCLLIVADSAIRTARMAVAVHEKNIDSRDLAIADVDWSTLSATAGKQMEATVRQPIVDASVTLAAPLLDELTAHPSVASAALSQTLPFGNLSRGKLYFWADNVSTSAYYLLSTPDLPNTLGLRVISGRTFSWTDRRAALISETVAKSLWPGASPIGRALRLDGEQEEREIVGVLSDAGGDLDRHGQIYLPLSQPYRNAMPNTLRLSVRCRVGCATLARDISTVVDKLAGAAVPVSNWTTARNLITEATVAESLHSSVLTGYAGFGLLVSGLGVFAMIAYLAENRARELAIRMALGATFSEIVVMLFSEGMICGMFGVATGTALAFSLMKVLTQFVAMQGFFIHLDGVATSWAILLCVSAIAASIPSCRGARLDPYRQLQH